MTSRDELVREFTRFLLGAGREVWMALQRAGYTLGGGATDHGALTGLGDLDHPQYAQVAAGAFTTTAPTSAVAATTGTNELARIVEVEALIAAFYGVLTAGYQPLDVLLTSLLTVGTDVDELWYGTSATGVATTPLTAFARTLLDDPAASNARATLGLGSLATQNGTFSGTSSGTNTGDQTVTLTGDVTGSGTGSFAASVANDAVTNAKLANMAAATIKGRASGAGTGDPTDLSDLQVATILSTYFSAMGHTHDAAEIGLDDTGWSGSLAGSGVRNVQALADWIDANLLP